MKRGILLFLLIILLGNSSFAQKMAGIGGELTALSIRPCAIVWISRNTGFEIFAGQSAEFTDFKPDDLEAGLKFLHTIIYNRTDRTYFGITGKWKWVNVYDPDRKTSLPIPGLLIGKEWYNQRYKLKGLAIELGYQVGTKEYPVYSPVNHIEISKATFNELPLIVNLRYTFMKRKNIYHSPR